MGGSTWSAGVYNTNTRSKIDSGTTFGYDRTVRATGVYKAHEDLDPKHRNAAGVQIRESRDSDEHPNSTPIVVGFDATGSMGTVPRAAQENLSLLFGLLLKHGYCDDPQISVTAYGDAYCDQVPLQISQFESDNRTDDNLNNLYLEGGGGGNNGETQTLLWYYLANHTSLDSFEKRGEKGYLFLIADEQPLDLTREHVERFIAPDEVATDSLTVWDAARKLQKTWDPYILLVDNWAARTQDSYNRYKELFGEDHVIEIQDPTKAAEYIGAMIGYLEGGESEDISDDLVKAGASTEVARTVSTAIQGLNPRGEVARVENVNLPKNDDASYL